MPYKSQQSLGMQKTPLPIPPRTEPNLPLWSRGCAGKCGVSWKAGRWMELSVLCQCSPLSCATTELGSPGSSVPTAWAQPWSQPCSLQCCLCPCWARCCGHSTHTTSGMGSPAQSLGFLAAFQCCQCHMAFPLPLQERKNNLKNNFELIRGG